MEICWQVCAVVNGVAGGRASSQVPFVHMMGGNGITIGCE